LAGWFEGWASGGQSKMALGTDDNKRAQDENKKTAKAKE
jgi:hypothetical protein